MKGSRSLSCFHESRFIGLCSLIWSRTPHKVCDTNISMTCFHKLTVNVFDCGNTSAQAMRDMVTAD